MHEHSPLLPGARGVHPVAEENGRKVVCVHVRKWVARAVHLLAAVAAADDCDELMSVLVVVGLKELDKGRLRGTAAQKGDGVEPCAPGVSALGLAERNVD